MPSGGARAGAGRPKKTRTFSDRTKAAILKAARELAKEYGEPIEKAMLRLCYQENTHDNCKASVWKSYLEALVAKESERKVDITERKGVGILLPPLREDPALKIVAGGK